MLLATKRIDAPPQAAYATEGGPVICQALKLTRKDTARMTSPRRMGTSGSANWAAMLDAAENLLRDEGCAALSSRRVAERVGVKQRLVYYYFRTMDDLIVATFARMAEREMARLNEALRSPRPLREIWSVCIHTADARIVSEFVALANRIPALREHVIAYIAETRRLQEGALQAALDRGAGAPARLPAASLAMLATSTALALNRETDLGIDAGHAGLLSAIDRLLDEFEDGGTQTGHSLQAV
jgi:AcrR family transcriptional regulator